MAIIGKRDGNSLYEGIMFERGYAEDFLRVKVGPKYFDLKGTQVLMDDFSSVAETGLSKDILEGIFSTKANPQSWKIGECMAECYLEENHEVRFHYESNRDARNPEGNLHGADIVGFSELEGETVFVFGEVKTSADKRSPPGVMSGRSGMIYQLKNIKDNNSIQESLIRWLAFKVQNKEDDDPFRADFIRALQAYFKNRKLRLVGILIRDTEPNEKDVKSGYTILIREMDPKMSLSLSAIYVPLQIDDFGNYLKRDGQ